MIRTVCDTGGQAAFVLMKAIIKTKKAQSSDLWSFLCFSFSVLSKLIIKAALIIIWIQRNYEPELTWTSALWRFLAKKKACCWIRKQNFAFLIFWLILVFLSMALFSYKSIIYKSSWFQLQLWAFLYSLKLKLWSFLSVCWLPPTAEQPAWGLVKLTLGVNGCLSLYVSPVTA